MAPSSPCGRSPPGCGRRYWINWGWPPPSARTRGIFRKRTGIRCKLSLPSDTLMLDRERSTAAFRIFQELLTNVARHANATRVDVAMRVDSGALVLTVEDNGKGIAEPAIDDPKSLGLLGMRERVLPFGGAIEIAGVRDKGTQVRVCIPLGLK